MKVYIASLWENKLMVQMVMEYLKSHVKNIKFTNKWQNVDKRIGVRFRAEEDYNAVSECDVLLALYPYGKGGSSEVGFALGSNKPILFLIDNLTHNDSFVLPTGVLEEFDGINVDVECRGYVLHHVNDLINILNYLNKKLDTNKEN